MSKTYGGKSKTNEIMYDEYPLKSLVSVLCFESLDEARDACRHYSITVKPMQIRTSAGPSVEEFIFWRQSTFIEPQDEEKGTLIPFPPQKMLRIIESKLKGATRLAVCRGQVSGDGAFLPRGGSTVGGTNPRNQSLAAPSTPDKQVATPPDRSIAAKKKSELERNNQEDAKFEALRKLQMELLRKQSEDEKKRNQEIEQEKRKHDEERRRKAEEARKNEEHQRMALIQIQQLEQQRIRQELVLKERQAQKDQRLRDLRLAEELKRKQAEEQQEQLKRKAIEAETLRLLEVERQNRVRQQEIENQELRRREENERLRKAEEQRQREHAESMRRKALQRELVAKQLHEEEQRRIDQEWAQKTEAALKRLVWGIWERKFPRHLSIKLSSLESPHAVYLRSKVAASELAAYFRRPPVRSVKPRDEARYLEDVVRQLIRQESRINLAELVASLLSSRPEHLLRPYPTLLLTVALFIPMPSDDYQEFCELVLQWITSRLSIGEVQTAAGQKVRVTVVDCSGSTDTDVVSDVTLVVLAPPWSDADIDSKLAQEVVSFTASRLDSCVPSVILSLRANPSTSENDVASKLASDLKESVVVTHDCLQEDAVEDALLLSSQLLAKALEESVSKDGAVAMDRFSVIELGVKALGATICKDVDIDMRGRSHKISDHVGTAMDCLVSVLDEYSRSTITSDEMMSQWPSRLFSIENTVVPNYFDDASPLPLDWKFLISADHVKPETDRLAEMLHGSVDCVVDNLLQGAPFSQLETCLHLMENRRYRECLHCALLYFEDNQKRTDDYVYIPRSMVCKLLDATAKRFEEVLKVMRTEAEDIDFVGPIDLPPYDGDATPTFMPQHGPVGEEVATISVDGAVAHENATGTVGNEDAKGASWDTRPKLYDNDADDAIIPPVSTAKKVARPSSKRERSWHSSLTAGTSRGSRDASHGRSPVRKRPKSVRESRAFTKRLRELLHGGTVDLLVGSVPLSYLLRDARDPVDDVAHYLDGKSLDS
jgi:hypothetical protein